MNTIATVTEVRSAGGLLPESKGGATEVQIETALSLAQARMMGIVTKLVYQTVAAYTSESSAAEREKQTTFGMAEARFAIALLPIVLANAQLQETGFKSESEIGKTRTRFGSSARVNEKFIDDFWASEAMLILAPYLDKRYIDQVTGDDYGFESDDGSFTMLSI